jgi:diguanylate cyclase (GGDEF)-like protein/PAS domain S-box-containing protein
VANTASTDQEVSNRPLEILYLEDGNADLESCVRELAQARFNCHCDPVSGLEGFAQKLATHSYDIVLADYQHEGFTGLNAFALLRESRKSIPFILVSGVLREDKALECVSLGIDDLILNNQLSRLPFAIKRSLANKSQRDLLRQAESSLRESEEKLRALSEANPCAIFIYQGANCRYANRAAEELTGYTFQELLGLSSWELIHPESRDVLIEHGLARLQGMKDPERLDLKILTRAGLPKWLDLTIGTISFNDSPAGFFTALDITDRKSREDKMRLQTTIDPLTGLANYRRLEEGFQAEVKRSLRTGRSFAFALFDLDGLKRINDSYGHVVGSRALCRLANVLQTQCRNIDLVARHGGDEFSVILPETDAEGAARLASRISQRLSSDSQEPALSVSSGTAAYPDGGNTIESLIQVADHQLYEMKHQQANCTMLSPAAPRN